MLPHSNATLTKVAGGGTSEDYDAPAGADTQKWAGRVGVYVQERTERVTVQAGSDVIVGRVAVVPAGLPVTFEQGDTLTLDFRGATVTETVRAIATRAMPGVLGTTRLVLEDA